jgi:hypothetical protein
MVTDWYEGNMALKVNSCKWRRTQTNEQNEHRPAKQQFPLKQRPT